MIIIKIEIYMIGIDKPLIIYGAGHLGKMAQEYFDKIDIPVIAIIDKKPELCKYYNFDGNYSNKLIVICIATEAVDEIIKELENKLKNNYKNYDLIPFYDITDAYTDRHPLNNGWYYKLTDEDIDKIKEISSKWEDDISRLHYSQFIDYHCNRDREHISDISLKYHQDIRVINNRYFIPEIISVLRDDEIFIDVGAHHGEFINKVLKVTKKFKKIYAFEADKYNFYNLFKNYGNCDNINLIYCTLGKKHETRNFFTGLGHISQITYQNDNYNTNLEIEEKEIKTLDDFSLNPTFIKIHVEGWESDIIRGASKTINEYHPILAVTSYHNKDGIWLLPNLIMGLNDYKFYFRLHNYQGTGAVIYATK